MTKVYKDKELGITKGKFPPPTVKISKNYYCPTPWDKKDTTDNATDEDVPVDSNGVKKKD
jgi:penicillin-binding protein 1A